jgi:hypothetical protein
MVIPSGAAQRRSRGIANVPVERPLTGMTAIPRLRGLAAASRQSRRGSSRRRESGCPREDCGYFTPNHHILIVTPHWTDGKSELGIRGGVVQLN